jgi:phage terminase large subunit-like protein
MQQLATCTPRYTSPRLADASDGAFICRFIETFCHVTKTSFGGAAGEPAHLRDWQRSWINDLYELRPDGRRRFRTGLVGLPKKNGKSFIGSALALSALVADAEPGAEIYSIAAAKDQAKIVFDEAKKMVEAEPELSSVLGVYRNHIEYKETGSVYRVLSADADVQDGLNPSFVIFDEVHRQPNDELWTVFTNAIGTRPQAMVLGITTAGWDKESLCYRLYEYGKRVASGEVDDPGFFFRWWEPESLDAPYDDPATWQASNPALGDFLDLEDFAAASQRTPEHDFRRLRCNQWTQTQSAWLGAGVWEGIARPERVVAPTQEVVLGFDGSYANDSTALVLCTVEETPHIAVVKCWEKGEGDDPAWRVPVAEVEQAVRAACANYRVREVACDPSGWKHSLDLLSDEGYPMVEFPQNSVGRMVPATKNFETAIYEQKVTHDGDPSLARHVANTVAKAKGSGYALYKEHASSKRHIDLTIAALMAFERASSHVPAEPEYVPTQVLQWQ